MRKLLLLMGFVLCLAMLTACEEATDMLNEALGSMSSSNTSDGDYSYEDEAQKMEKDTTYYNGFLGFSYTIPNGWWIYERNDINFTDSAEGSATEALLDINYGDTYNFIDLITFANMQYSSKDNHLGLYVSAEKVEGAETMEAYMDDYVEYMLEPLGSDTYELTGQDTAEIQGRHFEVRYYDVDQSGRPYCIATYTCAASNGYFLSLEANYWPENKNALENIRSFIEKGLSFIE